MKRLIIILLLITQNAFSQNFYHDTQGSVDVTGTGSVYYSLPIAMPPTIAGFAPTINLNYISGQQGGIAGQGWTIQGVSSINRSALRHDIDGESNAFINDGVDFDNNDKLSLDGQRLLLKSGSYLGLSTNGSAEYITEVQSNIKIQQFGLGNNTYFVVTATDGTRSWYGNHGGMNGVDGSSYYIVRQEDANGNFVTYHYGQVASFGSGLSIIEIRFSANIYSNPIPLNKIIFFYKQAVRAEFAFLGGVKKEKKELLDKIEVTTNGNLFKKYLLTHDVDSQLGYQRVTRIQEFNANNEPSNPVEFEYPNTIVPADKKYKHEIKNITTPFDFENNPISGDFDGDGNIDVISKNKLYLSPYISNQSTEITLPFSVAVNNQPGFSRHLSIRTIDNNGKHTQKNALVRITKPNNQSLLLEVYGLVVNSFQLLYNKTIALNLEPTPNITDYTNATTTECVNWLNSLANSSGIAPAIHIKEGDFKGDGISDLLITITRSQGTYFIQTGNGPYLDPGTGNTTSCPVSFAQNIISTENFFVDLNPNLSTEINSLGFSTLQDNFNFLLASRDIYTMDLDGDGKDEVLTINGSNYQIGELRKIGNSLQISKIADGNGLPIINDPNTSNQNYNAQPIFGDFNGDGKTDMIFPTEIANSLWKIYFSNPNSPNFFSIENHNITQFYKSQIVNQPCNGFWVVDGGLIQYNQYFAIDTNNDGKSDLVRVIIDARYQDCFDLDSAWQVVTYANNIGNSQASSTFSLEYTTHPNGPFTPPHYSQDSYFFNLDHANYLPVPLTGSFRNGINLSQLILVKKENTKFHVISFHKDVAKNNRLTKIKHSGGLIEDSFTYQEVLLPNSNNGLGNLSDFYSSSNNLSYPYVELKSLVGTYLVTKRTNKSLNIIRHQDFKYHGFVAQMHGMGSLGFLRTARSGWYHNSDTFKNWSVSINDATKRMVAIHTYDLILNIGTNFTFLGVPPTATTPNLNNLNTYIYEESINPANKLYTLLLKKELNYNFVKGLLKQTDYDYENPYNLTKKITVKNSQIQSINNIEGTKIITYEYLNNEVGTGQNYFIGKPKIIKTKMINNIDEVETTEELSYENSNIITKSIKITGTSEYLQEDFEYFTNGLLRKKTILAVNTQEPLPFKTTEYTYDPTNRFIKTTKDNRGFINTNLSYHQIYGTVLSESNHFGQITNYQFDNWGKPIEITDYLGKKITTTYQRNSANLTTTSISDDGSKTKQIKDILNKTLITSKNDMQNRWVAKSNLYDVHDRIIKESEPYFETTETPSLWTEYEYDKYSRIKTKKSPNGLIANSTYNLLTTTVTDGTFTKSITVNSLGQKIKSTDNGGTIIYDYDARGNMTKTVYENVVLKMEYDAWGRKTKLIDPSAGTFTYQYNIFGDLLMETSPQGKAMYQYSQWGDLSNKVVIGEHTSQTIDYSYNQNFQLTEIVLQDSLENFIQQQIFEYNNHKQLIHQLEKTEEVEFSKTFEYDDFGRVFNVDYHAIHKPTNTVSNTSIQSYYNAYGYLNEIQDPNYQQFLLQIQNTNARGQVTAVSYGNGLFENNVYNQFGYLNNSQVTQNNQILIQQTFQFDNQRANLLNRTSSLFNSNESFTYDNFDRLTSYPKIDGSTLYQDYDNKGRITQNHVGSYQYNESKPYQNSKISFGSSEIEEYYNQRSLQKITYNFHKGPVAIQEPGYDYIYFIYNANGQRAIKYYGDENEELNAKPFRKYYSADGAFEIDYDVLNGVANIYTYVQGNPYGANLVKKENNETSEYLYLHKDYLGTIIAISDEEGKIIEKRHFDAWGLLDKYWNINGQTELPDGINTFILLDRGYTGHEHLLSVGLVHMNGRLYDPILHRFLQPDNFIQDPENTQNYNRYGYVLNNPLRYNDPSGEEFVTAFIISLVVSSAMYVANALINNQPLTLQGFVRNLILTAISSTVTFGIGTGVEKISSNLLVKASVAAVAHGLFQGGMSALYGGKFWSGFASGSFSSIAATLYKGGAHKGKSWKGLGGGFGATDTGTVFFGTISGGAAASISGGNFWQGAAQGMVVSLMNHVAHEGEEQNKFPENEKELIERFKIGDVDPDGKPDLSKEGALTLNKNVEGLEDAFNSAKKPNIRFDLKLKRLVGEADFGDVNLNPNRIKTNLQFAAALFHEYRHVWQFESGNFNFWQSKYGYDAAWNYMERDAYWFQIKMGAGSFFDGYSNYLYYRSLTQNIIYKK